MARSPRIDYDGAWHHVINRGARKAPVFDTDESAGTFITTVGETAKRFALEVHAYAVMPSHYHLLVRSVRGNLSRAMRHLGAVFTQDRNRLFGWDGPVFRGRFRSQVISDERHLLTVSAYIHLNPIRANIIRRLDHRAWTSLRAYLGSEPPPPWLQTAPIGRLAGGRAQYARLVGDLRHRRVAWPEQIDVETGWLRLDGDETSDAPTARQTRGGRATTRQPNEILKEVCRVTGTRQAALRSTQRGRNGNPARRLAVWALARETELTHTQIGSFVGMSAGHVAITLRRSRNWSVEPLATWQQQWQDDANM